MPTHCLEVSGPFACFTRPEMKVERVSYDLITPSAARAIYEAILWKPAIRWHIHKIEVLNPIRWITIRRNEVGGVIPSGSVKTAMKKGSGKLGLTIEDDRQQRAALLLRDVRYRLHASLEVIRPGPGDPPAKYHQMFQRRAGKGQCVNQPYLGTREFAADFRLLDDLSDSAAPIEETRPLGWMLYDLDYSDRASPQPRFFNPMLNHGVIDVPAWNSEEIRG